MVRFYYYSALSVLEIRNQEELVLDCVKWVSNSLLFAHEISHFLIGMDVHFLNNYFVFFQIPFLLRHLFEKVNAENFDQFGSTLVEVFCLIE